ncbi:SRPBCC family protein [Saccharibacillus sacchari]|uniref:SRPBCC family protein n=1 Tax=Saccharibacillus sacchari TaxID=456493 RepID=UPI0004AD0007|nr:SRPBCC family protein [Saccharibacillus sacchari]
MKKSSLSFALRGISLLLGIVGILLVLRSTELGLAQADSLTSSQDEYGSGTRFWLVQQSGIAAYRTLGAILAGVGLFQALRPLSRLEMQRITVAAEQEDGVHVANSNSLPTSGFAQGGASRVQGPRTDSASRVIQASPQKLYWAFVDPDVLVRWLPPEGMRGKIERFEPQAGGAYRMVLTYTGSSGSAMGKSSTDTDIVEGTFVELVPGEKIVQAVTFDSPDPAFAGEMRMTWNLQAAGSGTEVTVVCEQVPSGIGRKDHEKALASTLQNLERIVS